MKWFERADPYFLVLALAAGFLLDQTIALGFALGTHVVIVIAIMFYAFAMTAGFAILFESFIRPKVKSYFRHAPYILVQVSIAVTINIWTARLLHEDWNWGEVIARNKIEYFCLTRHQPARCVNLIRARPQCALAVEKWKRDKMVTLLEADKLSLKK